MAKHSRLVLKEVDISPLDNGKCQIIVKLSVNNVQYASEVSAFDTEDGQLHGVAQATLNAIGKKLGDRLPLKLVYTKQIFLKEVSKVVFLVIVQLGRADEEQFLSGVCLFTQHKPEIAAKAVLNALNRTLSKYD